MPWQSPNLTKECTPKYSEYSELVAACLTAPSRTHEGASPWLTKECEAVQMLGCRRMNAGIGMYDQLTQLRRPCHRQTRTALCVSRDPLHAVLQYRQRG